MAGTKRRPVELTAVQQNMVAAVAQVMAGAAYDAQTGQYDRARAKLLQLENDWLLLEVTSQEWGQIYDRMHRTGANAEPG